MEQNDYRRGGKPNVFFGVEKRFFGMKVGVFAFNTAVLARIDGCVARFAALDFAPATRSAKKLKGSSALSEAGCLFLEKSG